MSKSNDISELNNRSLKLTDAELAMVEKFSVLLPMNELPEIVIANREPVFEEPESDRGIPDNAIIPFERVSAGDDKYNHQDVSQNKKDLASETSQEFDAETKAVQTSVSNSRISENQTESKSPEPIANPEVTVEMPKDELSISRQNDAKDVDTDASTETDDAIFDIAEHGRFYDRVESISENIESCLSADQPSAFVLAAPVESQDQELIFNSLLMSIATRNSDRKLIGVQAVAPTSDLHEYSVGLGHVLSDEYLLEDVVIPSNCENLDYLAYSESQLSSSAYRNRINRMVDELKKHYDLVFVNAGLATSTETLALSDSADSFYLLIQMLDAEQDPVVQAAELLRKKGARLAGCILSGYQREAS